MAYEFLDYLKPVGASRFALIEDIFLKGAYRVLQSEAERDNLDPTTCKVGMIVNCLEESRLYLLSELRMDEDEFGDTVAVFDWTDFTINIPNTPTSESKAIGRWNLTLSSGMLAPGEEKVLKIPLAIACMLKNLSVNSKARVKLRETEQAFASGDLAMFNHSIEEDLVADKLYFGKAFTFPDGTPLRTRYTNMFMNKDPVTDKFLYLTITNTDSMAKLIIVRLNIVALHT